MSEKEKIKCWFCKTDKKVKPTSIMDGTRFVCETCKDKANAYALDQLQTALESLGAKK